MGDVVAIELDLAALGLDQAGNHVERRGLAGAVRPQQTDRLAAPHVEADAVDHPPSAVGLFEVVRGQVAPHGLLPRRRRYGLLPRRGRLRARARPGGGGSDLLAAGERHRPTQRGQADILPAAVARSSSGLRRAAMSEQREDVDQASALETGVQRNPSMAKPNIADGNGPQRFVNSMTRSEPCRSSVERPM